MKDQKDVKTTTAPSSKRRKHRTRKLSIFSKLMIATTIVIALACMAIGAVSYANLRTKMIQMGVEEAKIAAQAAAASVDGDIISNLQPGQEDSVHYTRIKESLQNQMKAYGVKYIYTLKKDGDKLVYVIDAYDGKDYSRIGDEYTDDPYSVIQPVYEEGKVVAEEEITVSDGEALITAYAPITNAGNTVVGVLGSDYDANGIKEYLQRSLLEYIALFVICLLVSLVIVSIIIRAIVRNIDMVNDKLYDLVHSDGDLTKTLDVKTGDETEITANNVNDLLAYFRNIMLNISHNSDTIKSTSGNIAASLDHAQGAASEVSATMEEMSSAMEETSASISQINELMNQIKQSFDDMVARIQNGRAFSEEMKNKADQTGQEAIAQQNDAKKKVDEMAALVDEKIEKSKAVDQINVLTENILNITQQTNLLSLNASIEAARAGEAGRGFAVVADEIGSLANDSAQSAEQIKQVSAEVINAVQELADEARAMIEFINTTAMSGYTSLVETSEANSKNAEDVDKMMEEFSTISADVQQNLDSINEATNNVSIAVEESAQGVVKAAEKSVDMSNNMKEISGEANSSSEVSDSLYSEVNKFKLQ